MGKVDTAFDHIKDNHEINELSVVLYSDSFFYGLWDNNSELLKTGYHPITNLSALIQLWQYYYNFQNIKVLSTIKPFVHLADEDYEPDYFDLYFQGLYNLESVDQNVRTVDKIRKHEISTLHLVEEKALSLLSQLAMPISVAHISTAMVNYCSAENEQVLCYLADNILHLSHYGKKGFRLYNQFDCYYEQDYLYFLLAVFKKYKLDHSTTTVRIGGALDENSELYALLSSYFKKIKFLSKSINISADLSMSKSCYSDLHLCRTCV